MESSRAKSRFLSPLLVAVGALAGGAAWRVVDDSQAPGPERAERDELRGIAVTDEASTPQGAVEITPDGGIDDAGALEEDWEEDRDPGLAELEDEIRHLQRTALMNRWREEGIKTFVSVFSFELTEAGYDLQTIESAAFSGDAMRIALSVGGYLDRKHLEELAAAAQRRRDRLDLIKLEDHQRRKGQVFDGTPVDEFRASIPGRKGQIASDFQREIRSMLSEDQFNNFVSSGVLSD